VISRRKFVATAGGGLLGVPLAAGAQSAAKIYRIGVLGTLPPGTSGQESLWEPFVGGLRELGYVEGENLVIVRRHAAEGKPISSRHLRPTWSVFEWTSSWRPVG
jgi:hypothetical protein